MRELTNEDILGPGIIIGRENEIIVELRKVLKKISDVEPASANLLATKLVLMARFPKEQH